MAVKIFTKGELRYIIQDDIQTFVELLIYHKDNNINYFNSVLIPFYLEQKSFHKIPEEIIKYIEENNLSEKQIEVKLTKESGISFKALKFNSISGETNSEFSNMNIKNNIDKEKKTCDELHLIARNNFEHFKKLADNYSKLDKEYYGSVVLPVLIYHKKRILAEKLDEENEKRKTEKRKTFVIYGGFVTGILILVLGGYLYINNIIEEADSKRLFAEKKLKEEYEKKNEKIKQELEQKIRDEYSIQEENNKQRILEEERKKKLEKEKIDKEKFQTNKYTKDEWNFIGTNANGHDFYITGFYKTNIGANVWVKENCNRDCGVYQGTSILALASLDEYNFTKNSYISTIGHIYLIDGRDITQYLTPKETKIISGTIGDKVIQTLKIMYMR